MQLIVTESDTKSNREKKMEMWINSQRDNIHNSPDSFHGNLTWLLSMAELAEEIDLIYEWNGIQVELTSNKHLMPERRQPPTKINEMREKEKVYVLIQVGRKESKSLKQLE